MKLYLKLLIIGIFLSSAHSTALAQIAVIANKSVAAHTIDMNTLKSLYSLDAREVDGSTVKLFCYKEEDGTTTQFFQALGKSFNDSKKIWIRMKLTGNGEPPTAVGSEEELIEKVASTPGAIGFVQAEKATGKVKILLTIK